MRWTRKSIIEEIRRMKSAGGELNYSSVEREHLNLTRAAAWHFGNWRGAVEAAGIDYDGIRKYRRWSRERVIARIRDLHKAGADLNWRAVSTRVDPSLAAAALRIADFAAWRDAIAAAGLDIEDVARYRFWDEARVLAALRDAKKRDESLSSKAAQQRDQPLFCAARRRFGSWNNALQSAGIAPQRRRREESSQATATPSNSAVENSAPKKSTASQAASTRAAKTASVKTVTVTTERPATKSAPVKAAPAKTGAAKKEAAPNAASTRAKKAGTETKTPVAQPATKSGATKNSSTAKAPAAKTATSSAAKASSVKAAAKTPVAETSASKPAAKPTAAKSAKTTALRAAKK